MVLRPLHLQLNVLGPVSTLDQIMFYHALSTEANGAGALKRLIKIYFQLKMLRLFKTLTIP